MDNKNPLRLDTIHNGDCLELLARLPDEYVDLIIADPPYSIHKDFGNGHSRKTFDEWLVWSKQWLLACERVLKNGGSIFVYGIHHSLCYLQCYLDEIELTYGRQFIWHYENGWSTYSASPAATYEPILWFWKGDSHTYHLIREPYKSTERLRHRITKNGKIWKPNPAGRHGGDVWHIPTLAGRRFAVEKVNHPTQKPLALCDKIIVHFSNPGDIVLVPFAGSGSECVSAFRNARHFIGFELNPEYISIAEERLRDTAETVTDLTHAKDEDSDLCHSGK